MLVWRNDRTTRTRRCQPSSTSTMVYIAMGEKKELVRITISREREPYTATVDIGEEQGFLAVMQRRDNSVLAVYVPGTKATWNRWHWVPKQAQTAIWMFFRKKNPRLHACKLTEEIASRWYHFNTKKFCWICDRHFNSEQQWLDHIEGSLASDGGKHHMKCRHRWILADRPSAQAWLTNLRSTAHACL